MATAALTAYWTSNTLTDTSPWDAVLRSTAYYTPSYAALTKTAQPPTGNNPQWALWAAHQAHTTVTLTPVVDDPPPANPTTTYLEYSAGIVPHGANNWTGPTVTHIAWVTLTRTSPSSPWLVSNLQIQ